MGSPHWHRVWSGSIRGTRRDPSANAFSQDRRQILNSDTFLLHRIAIAQSDSVAQRRILLPERFEINGHTERRTDFVLPAVSPTDRAALVVEDSHMWPKELDDLLRFRDERVLVFEQRKDRTLDRRHPWTKTQDYSRFHFAFI